MKTLTSSIIWIIGIILLGYVIFLGINIASHNKQMKQTDISNQIIKNIKTKGTEIKSYAKLVEAVKSGDKFLVEYSGLNNVYIRNFNKGTLNNTKSIIFNGSQYWTSNNAIYNHSYKYEFLPNNKVKISGNDTYASDLNTSRIMSASGTGSLGKSVIIYAYI